MILISSDAVTCVFLNMQTLNIAFYNASHLSVCAVCMLCLVIAPQIACVYQRMKMIIANIP